MLDTGHYTDLIQLLKKKERIHLALDSKEPTGNFKEFLLRRSKICFTSRKHSLIQAEELFAKTEKDAKERLAGYKKLAEVNKKKRRFSPLFLLNPF